jgi:hypothetical protein
VIARKITELIGKNGGTQFEEKKGSPKKKEYTY